MANQNFKVKKGLEVGTAFTATSDGLNVTGIITATQFSGDGSGLTGITAAGSGVVVQEEGSNVGTAATINFIGSNVTAAISGGVASVTVAGGGGGDVVTDTTPQLGGNLDLNSKNITGTGSIAITGGINATGVSTFQESVTFQSHASFGDNDKANFGAGNDLQIYHDGSDGYIDNVTGELYIRDTNAAGTNRIFIQPKAGENAIIAREDGNVELYYDNSKRFETTNAGVTITGDIQLSSHLDMPDSAEIRLGTGDDLSIYHNGTNSHIDNVTGNLIIRTDESESDILLRSDDGSGGRADYILCDGSSGAVKLYYYGSQKLNTKSDGIDVTGEVQCDSLDVDGAVNIDGSKVTYDSSNGLKLADSTQLRLGTGNDLRIFHDGSNNYIQANTGNIVLKNSTGDYFVGNISNGAVELLYNNSKKFETTNTGATVTGTLAATAVTGDGSGLTSLTGASAGTYGASTNTPIITVDANGRITGIATVATAGAGGGGGISNLVEDTTPQLGGNLDLNSKDITGSGNIDYTGNLKVTGISTITGVAGFSSHVTLPDYAEIQVGNATGGDLKIYHDGTNSYVSDAGTGGLKITGGDVYIRNPSDQDMIHASSGSFVKLYHNNALRLQTNQTGVSITDDLNVAGVSTFQSHVHLGDSDELRFGAGDDLRMYHDGTHSYIHNDTGNLKIESDSSNNNDIQILNNNTTSIANHSFSYSAKFISGGSVELYEAGSKKFETTSSGATVTGALTATTIVKSGGSSSQYLMADGSVSTTVGISTNSSNIQATWSVTSNGSSAYRFTGPGNDAADDNPDLYLVKGQRYRFINNSGGSHPFQIRASVGGSAYSAGVTNNGAASGNIEWNVQHDAPARLYYQCTAHSGMVGNIYITGGGQWENTSVAASGTPEIYTDYNVGVGTANPGERLHLTTTSGNCKLRIDAASAASVDFYNSGTRFSDMFTDASTGNFTITNRQNADIILRTNGTNERVYVKSSGEVSIGGFTPGAGAGILQISGGLRVAGSASASDTTSPYIYRTSGSDHLNIATNGVERLRITAGGNVNINGTPPWTVTGGSYRNLSISGNDASSSGFLWLGNGAAATNADFDLGRVNFVNGANIVAQIKGTTQTSANDDGRISFLTKSTGSNIAEKLRITSDGRFKIGSISDYSNNVTNCPVYIAMQTDITAIGDDEGGATAGLVRIEETGSNNNRYHGIDLRNTNSGDIRILNQDVGVSDRGDLVIAMPDGDANDGIHNKMRFNSRQSSIQISGKGGAVAANNDVTHTDIYIATKTGVTAVNTGAGGEVAGLIRFEDIGSNNSRYHGIELRNKNSGDVRIMNLDEATSNKASMVFATDNGSDIAEVMRLTSGGNVNIGDFSQTDSKVTIVDVNRPIAEATLNLQSSTTSGAADTGPVLRFYGHSGSEGRYHASIKGAKENGTSGNTAGYLAFNTRPAGGAMAERLRIQSDGNVIPASNDAYNLGLNGNRWNKVWTNYVRHGTRSATYEKTFTATSDGSGNLTFECGILWLIDDSSFEVFCHIDRTGSYNSIAARYKFYGSKVSGFGTQNTYRSDTGTYYIISPMSNPTIDAYTPSGQGSSHGTRIAHTGAAANAEYRLTMLINWVGQREVT